MSALPLKVTGMVAHGDKRGRVLGFPTANINSAIPAMDFGVYASVTRISGEDTAWPSVTSYGTRPTFAGVDQRIETHILDFERDIYGREIEVQLVAFIRAEQKFDSVDDLLVTMQGDLEKVRALSVSTAG